MDQVLKQLGIEWIFSAPFSQILKTNIEELCEKDLSKWDQYLNQVHASFRVTPNLATAEMPFFLVYGRDPNLPLHQLVEPMQ